LTGQRLFSKQTPARRRKAGGSYGKGMRIYARSGRKRRFWRRRRLRQIRRSARGRPRRRNGRRVFRRPAGTRLWAAASSGARLRLLRPHLLRAGRFVAGRHRRRHRAAVRDLLTQAQKEPAANLRFRPLCSRLFLLFQPHRDSEECTHRSRVGLATARQRRAMFCLKTAAFRRGGRRSGRSPRWCGARGETRRSRRRPRGGSCPRGSGPAARRGPCR